MTAQKHITNLSLLYEISGDDKNILNELINIFIEQSKEFIISITNDFKNKNWDKLGAIAHKAKSSVRTMGMEDLGNKLNQIEHLSKGNARLLLQQKIDSGIALTLEEEKRWLEIKDEKKSDINLIKLKPIVTQFLSDYPLAVKELELIQNQL